MGGMYLAFQFDFLFILGHVRYGRQYREGWGRRLTLYGAYHFARRVLPLTEVSTHDIGHCYRGIACGALDGGDALPVLDQNER